MKKIYVSNGKVFVDNDEIPLKLNNTFISVSHDFAGIILSRGHTRSLLSVGDALGTSAASFARMLNGAMYRCHVVPNKDIHSRLAYTGVFGYNDQRIPNINAKIGIIRQYQKDGNNHLAGFGALIGDAMQAKSLLGKGLWKKLCVNSRTRNDLIVHYGLSIIESCPKAVEDIKFLIDIAMKIPSTVLRKLSILSKLDIYTIQKISTKIDIIRLIRQRKKVPLSMIDADLISQTRNIIYDTQHMCKQLEEPFNPEWCFKRMLEEHDIMTTKIAVLGTTTTPIPLLKPFSKIIRCGNDITAVLLDNSRKIVTHGVEMHHCVGSYVGRVIEGKYVIYKLNRKCDISTIGFAIDPDAKSITHTQHYHKYNGLVNDDVWRAAAMVVKKDVMEVISKFKGGVNKVYENYKSDDVSF